MYVRRVVVLVRVGRRSGGRRRFAGSVGGGVGVVRVVRNRSRVSRRSSSSGVGRTMGSRVRSVVTLGELGAGSSRSQEVVIVANDTAFDLLLVRESHAEEVRVYRDASSATVGGGGASSELRGDRIRSASALGLAINGNDTDGALFRVVAIILIDDNRVDDGRRAVSSRAGNDSARSGETSRVEVENRIADGFTVSRELTGREVREVVRGTSAVGLDFSVGEGDAAYTDEAFEGRCASTGAVREDGG